MIKRFERRDVVARLPLVASVVATVVVSCAFHIDHRLRKKRAAPRSHLALTETPAVRRSAISGAWATAGSVLRACSSRLSLRFCSANPSYPLDRPTRSSNSVWAFYERFARQGQVERVARIHRARPPRPRRAPRQAQRRDVGPLRSTRAFAPDLRDRSSGSSQTRRRVARSSHQTERPNIPSFS